MQNIYAAEIRCINAKCCKAVFRGASRVLACYQVQFTYYATHITYTASPSYIITYTLICNNKDNCRRIRAYFRYFLRAFCMRDPRNKLGNSCLKHTSVLRHIRKNCDYICFFFNFIHRFAHVCRRPKAYIHINTDSCAYNT